MVALHLHLRWHLNPCKLFLVILVSGLILPFFCAKLIYKVLCELLNNIIYFPLWLLWRAQIQNLMAGYRVQHVSCQLMTVMACLKLLCTKFSETTKGQGRDLGPEGDYSFTIPRFCKSRINCKMCQVCSLQ